MTFFPDTLIVLLIALTFDALFGDPDAIWRRMPHPVVWMGRLIDALDRRFNREVYSAGVRRGFGAAALIGVVAVSAVAALAIQRIFAHLPAPHDLLATGVTASTLLAQKSLYDHIVRVRAAFDAGGLAQARKAVSAIVGRDPEQLDEGGVCRAAIESCAENFSDGVVAPALFFALFGLPGIAAYKAINTADSMIGHRTSRLEAFGWTSARLDDLVNYVPARIAGVLIAFAGIAAGGKPLHALRAMLRDASLHRSPNAGWPESAMAASLGVALAGPRAYPGYRVNDAYLHDEGRKHATPIDIDRALRVFIVACVVQAAIYAGLALTLR